MNKRNSIVIPVTASDVREWFANHPKSVPAEGAHTVAKNAKGRIHPTARAVFNAKSGKVYNEGTPKCMPLPYIKKSASGANLRRTAVLPKSEVRALAGAHAGLRGVLSPDALDAASEAYTALVNG